MELTWSIVQLEVAARIEFCIMLAAVLLVMMVVAMVFAPRLNRIADSIVNQQGCRAMEKDLDRQD